MNLWKQLRVRWMYWRYRNITQRRQKLQLRMAARRSNNPVYMAPSGRGIRPVGPTFKSGIAKSWIMLIAVSVVMGAFQHIVAVEGYGPDITFLGDILILAAGYIVWLKA